MACRRNCAPHSIRRRPARMGRGLCFRVREAAGMPTAPPEGRIVLTPPGRVTEDRGRRRGHACADLPVHGLVGQDLMRKALVLNAVDPSIGGVLIRGEKGTAKTTAVRGIAAVLPPRRAVIGCPFSCVPGQKEGWTR